MLHRSAICAAALLLVRPSPVGAWSIYGTDDRKDLHQVKDERLARWARNAVGVFRRWDLEPIPDSPDLRLPMRTLGEKKNLCPGEAFHDQPTGPHCSGSLVGEALVLTAGHCVLSEEDCKNTRFVFDFTAGADGKFPSRFSPRSVYSCAAIVERHFEELGDSDWALLRLDRAVAGRTPLKLRREGTAKKGTPLAMIGHPSGLPLKVVAGGSVLRENVEEDGIPLFLSDLDGLGGNSGSPVLNLETGEVEGVYVRGEGEDYVLDPDAGCYRLRVLPKDGAHGGGVVPAKTFAGKVPEIGAAAALQRSESFSQLKSISGR